MRRSGLVAGGGSVFVQPARFVTKARLTRRIIVAHHANEKRQGVKIAIDLCKATHYTLIVIRSFKHKGLELLYESGKGHKVNPNLRQKILRRLDFLNKSRTPEEMNMPGFAFHGLQGKPKRYAVSVSGNWRITFGWDDGAIDVHLEDYH